MENPEEVLQALDEFQKLRPSEIPRELEDYLSFVAKTGDPVYQWSLIKPLFREKLVRVMTDFYETSPTLDLTPSPNIEQFNYDSMKGNLLDLLESFANAPFTVQRICELLISPRKEYNRVDKFMRAIEKNILVVSTREPGSRRSENGDSMINGSMDEENPPHEVEMDSWVKDCTTNVLPDPEITQKSPKSSDMSSATSSVIQEKSDTHTGVNNFTELSTGTLNTVNDSKVDTSDVDNLGTLPDASGGVGDVPEAIMNEDTSSQPSLDSESDDSDVSNSKKLTFQSRDFGKDVKSDKIDDADEKISEDESGECKKPDDAKVEGGKLNINEHCHPDLSIDDEIVEKRARLDEEISTVTPVESVSSNASIIEPKSSETEESSHVLPSDHDSGVEVKHKETKETLESSENAEVEPEPEKEPQEPETTPEESQPEAEEIIETDFQELPEYQTAKTTASTETLEMSPNRKEDGEEIPSGAKPIIEEPPHEDVDKIEEKSGEAEEETSGIVIQEAMEDDAKSVNTMVPDPIPIVEEPREETKVSSSEETSLAEIIEPKCLISEAIEGSGEILRKEEPSVDVEACQPDQDAVLIVEESEEAMEKGEIAESMDVDSEDAMPVMQQDEPMEEECGDGLKS